LLQRQSRQAVVPVLMLAKALPVVVVLVVQLVLVLELGLA
jgi:hypothetical protein